MSTQRRAAPAAPPYLPDDEHRQVVAVSEPCKEVPVPLPVDLVEHVAQWAIKNQLTPSEALRQVIERGLAAEGAPKAKRKRGQPPYWGVLRYMFLYDRVPQILEELKANRKPYLPIVTVEDAIEELCKRYPEYSRHPIKSLVARYYDAQKQLAKIHTEQKERMPGLREQPYDPWHELIALLRLRGAALARTTVNRD
jgi:hypothetical protein